MTRDQIAAGLEELVLGLAKGLATTDTPAGFVPHEWAYVVGFASAAILDLRARLIGFEVDLARATPRVGWADKPEET